MAYLVVPVSIMRNDGHKNVKFLGRSLINVYLYARHSLIKMYQQIEYSLIKM